MARADDNCFTRVVKFLIIFFLAVCPFGLSAVKILFDSSRYCETTFRALMFLFGILFMILCLSMLWMKNINKIAVAFVLFIVSFFLRVIASLLLRNDPVSDFKSCYDFAVTGIQNPTLSVFSYLGSYAITLRGFFLLIGPSILNAQILNAFVTSLIPVLIYIGSELFFPGSSEVGLIGAVFYGTYPGIVIYTSVLSCEHFSQLFIMISLILYLNLEKYKLNKTKYFFFAILSAISFGLLSLYKNILVVVFPAIFMAIFCYEILPVLMEREILARRVMKVGKILLNFLLVVVVAFFVHRAGLIVIEKNVGKYDDAKRPSVIAYVYDGLSPEGKGFWNRDAIIYIDDVMARSESRQEADYTFIKKLWDYYSPNPRQLLSVLKNKFLANWTQEAVYYYWATHGDKVLLKPDQIESMFLFGSFPTVVFGFMSLTIAFGMLIQLFKCNLEKSLFVVAGIVFLFVLMLFLIEGQGRYKSTIIPLISILFAMSCANIIYAFGRIKKRILSGNDIVVDEFQGNIL